MLFDGWEEVILAFLGLALLLQRAFGEDFWAFVQNIKATGGVPDGWSGLVANTLGILFFGLVGAAVSVFTDAPLVPSILAGALVGFLISLRASEIHQEKVASGQVESLSDASHTRNALRHSVLQPDTPVHLRDQLGSAPVETDLL